jgi:hypothetical protein
LNSRRRLEKVLTARRLPPYLNEMEQQVEPEWLLRLLRQVLQVLSR